VTHFASPGVSLDALIRTTTSSVNLRVISLSHSSNTVSYSSVVFSFLKVRYIVLIKCRRIDATCYADRIHNVCLIYFVAILFCFFRV